jgi:YD repeat-containing protein
MRITNILMLFTLILLGYDGYAQEVPSNPTASSMVSAVGYPVEYSTGMPSISAPLYSMPTRSKSVNVDLQLSYHAASGVASSGKNSAAYGRGWSLSAGGVIQSVSGGFYNLKDHRVSAASVSESVWSFNFQGMSGRVVLKKGSGILEADVYESSGRKINVRVDYTQNENSFNLKGFIFRDEEGIQYKLTSCMIDEGVFGIQERKYVDSYIGVVDTARVDPSCFNCPLQPKYVRYTAKRAFHLNQITDMHDKPLVRFLYKEFKDQDEGYHSGEYRYSYTLQSITSHGFGKIDLLSNIDQVRDFYYDGLSVYDYNDNKIKDFGFEYDYGPYGSIGENKLIALREYDPDGNEGQVYSFEYKNMFSNLNENSIMEDDWGYPNLVSNNCSNQGTADNYSTVGVLEKMILPTGGCVIYDFEPNTYSYYYGRPLDYVLPDSGPEIYYTDPEYFYRIEDCQRSFAACRNNYHNYEFSYDAENVIGYHSFSSQYNDMVFSFSNDNTNNGIFFLKVHGAPHLGPPFTQTGESNTVHPSFTLSKNGIAIEQYYYNTYHDYFTGEGHYGWGIEECLGLKIDAGTGNYTITMNANTYSPATGWAKAYKLARKPVSDLKKWWYGGGIRIKSISYFTEKVIAMGYLDHPENYHPARKISFDYNFLDQPNRSSGALRDIRSASTDAALGGQGDVVIQNLPPVSYTNVGVTDTSVGGKTEYTFYSPVNIPQCDFTPDNANECDDYRVGKLLLQKVYNSSGKLLRQEDYEYNVFTYTSAANIDPTTTGEPKGITAGWCDLKKQVTKDYDPIGSPTDVLETTDEYTYYDTRKIKSHKTSSAIGGEFLETKYTYNLASYPNLVFEHVYLPKTVEKYRNNELVAKSNTEYYVRTVVEPLGTTTTKFLPQLVQSAKANNTLETKIKINKYDDYSHVLETEIPNGPKTSYIWGYNNTQIIAKVENMAYDAIPSALIDAARSASDMIGTGYNEGNVITALNNLRTASQLSQAFVTAYTYKPLIGLSTVIDARGKKQIYEYDTFGRLEKVRDNEGKILSENEYHIKQQ